MNVGTSSAVASTSDVSSTRSQARTSSSSKTKSSSFDEEMKTASKTEETKDSSKTDKKSDDKKVSNNNKTDKKEVKSESDKLSNGADDIVNRELLAGGVNFTDFKYHNESQSLLTQNIQNLLDTKDVMNNVNSASTFDYDTINMSDQDANFFANLVQNTDMSMKSIASQISNESNTQGVQQSVQISSVLMEKLSESMKTSQPFRIDFDKDVSVIIKVNKDGSLAANFIPGDKAVEQYLRNNIPSLRQRFDEQNLSYSELSYSNSRQQQQERRRRQQQGE